MADSIVNFIHTNYNGYNQTFRLFLFIPKISTIRLPNNLSATFMQRMDSESGKMKKWKNRAERTKNKSTGNLSSNS